MKWTRSTSTSMRCDPWTICGVRIKRKIVYELWHDKQPHAVGHYDSFDQAKAAAESIEMAGQG